ncbi:MAG: type II secretion system secretin GspD [Deltaproteobacteria bacterium]|uniref:Type II secretion system secretin GspD n=1 Tax=Candidatus Desulfacyla euxinica TaxID=2841693 RepID=A0A8J6T814_9DELT|nr:type II secretion system secretin GspD [Candidatus Desulfacyla euxinica]
MTHSKTKYLQCFLWVAVCLMVTVAPVGAARIAGEEGVTPVAPQTTQKAEEAVSPKTPVPTPAVTAAPPVLRKKGASAPEVNRAKPPKELPVMPPPQEKTPIEKRTDTEKPADSYVTIDFDNVDIQVFIKFISELTGKNFVIDKAVRGKVTIVSPNKISKDEAYKVFESVLEVHGYTTVPAGRITKIVPAVSARTKSVETRLREGAIGPEDKVITQLIPLRYADPQELKKLFTPLISKSSVIVSYSPARTLIVTDVQSNIKRLLSITKAIDVEGVGEELSVVPLEYATATVLAKSLGTVFQKRGVKTKSAFRGVVVIKIVPDERTNSLILLASEDDTVKIKKLVKLLDREPPRGEGDIRVYYLQHANAEDLTKVLTSLPSKKTPGAKRGKVALISKEARIVADSATNSLVIMATKDDYRVLEEVITKLDIPRLMVYIEALIMEVNVDKDFSLGVEWEGIKTFSYDGKNAGVFAGSSPSGFSKIGKALGGTLTSGFSLGVITDAIEIGGVKFPNLAAIVHAYQQDTEVNILSTPQILTTDNEEAEIYVGKNVPYISSANITEAQQNYTTYQYKDVGVTLKVTPQISQERFVRLNIFQEVSRLIGTVASNTPSTYKRLAQTTVIVKDANTVVIGGLIGDETTHIDYKVPCLGDIPLISWLFKGTSKRIEKTNLFVFLTPHIIQNPAEAKKIYEDKKDQIETIKEGVIKMYKREGKAPAPEEKE